MITVEPSAIPSAESFGTVFVLSGQKEGVTAPPGLTGDVVPVELPGFGDLVFEGARVPGVQRARRKKAGE